MTVRKGPWVALAASIVIAMALAFGLALHVQPAVRSTTVTSSPRVHATVAVTWRQSDLFAAPAPGRICITDKRYGEICATYRVGDRPADALTRVLAARGLAVAAR